jgi:uncharacterized protein YigA (DUF484 family)
MARALYGYVNAPTNSRDIELQVVRLRGRVRELEAEVAELRAEAAARDAIDRQLALLQDEPALA